MSDQQRTAIVTGAARGIGAAIAKRLSSDGFAVAVLDLDEAACKPVVGDITAAGGTALAVGVDVGDEDAVQAAVTRVAEELGAPTVLVNNAGITRDNLLFKMTTDDWDAVMNVHLRGSFLMSRAAQKYMTEAKWGRIVNLSSTSALGNRGQANYAAAKAGLQGFTKTLAVELGKFGVTANAIAPVARTRMSDNVPAGLAEIGEAEDVAPIVVFLLSDAARNITGQIYTAVGSRVAVWNQPKEERSMTTDGRWTPEEIAERIDEIGQEEMPLLAPLKEALAKAEQKS